MQRPRGRRKTKEGRVVSDCMDKTIVVAVQRLVRHRLYGRTMRKTNKLKAHDADNECRVGDQVRVEETRPLSKQKRWRVIEVLRKAR